MKARFALVAAVIALVVACGTTGSPGSSVPGPSTASTSDPGSSGTGPSGQGIGPAPSSTRATGGTGTTPTRPTFATSDTDSEPVGVIAWTSCAGGLECGTLTVPVIAGRSNGATIDLAVARRPAKNRSERIGSLFLNPGGPGASGVTYLRSGAPKALNDRFDLVSWDPRGVGASRPLRCDSEADNYRALDWSPNDAAAQARLDESAAAIAADCADNYAEVLAHVNTDDTARDLDRLRRALGDDQLSYMGFSYGTFIGLRYAELYPTRVRAVVLDGVVDPTDDLEGLLAGQTKALELQINDLFSSCSPPRCRLDQPATTYDRVAARVEQQPLPAGPSVVGPTALAYAAISSSYDPASHRRFLDALADADAGDGTGLAALADQYFSIGGYTSYLGVLCTDQPHPQGGAAHAELARRLHALSPRFGDAVANEVLACAYWAAPATIPTAPVRAVGAAPILVVGNTGDVATPYESAQNVARALDRGVLLTYEGEGHTSFGRSNCVDDAIKAYLNELVQPDPAQHCR